MSVEDAWRPGLSPATPVPVRRKERPPPPSPPARRWPDRSDREDPPMPPLAEHIAILAADTRQLRRDLLAGLPPTAADWRPAPGLPSLGWHVVHGAYVRAAVLVLGDGGPDDGIARWRGACHVGCPLAADGAFGSLADALAEAERLDGLATARVAGWDPDAEARPLPAADPDLLQDPSHDRRTAALTMAAHDAYHLGQVALIRRLRGIAPLE